MKSEHSCEQIGEYDIYKQHDRDWVFSVYHLDADARSIIYIDYCPFCGELLK